MDNDIVTYNINLTVKVDMSNSFHPYDWDWSKILDLNPDKESITINHINEVNACTCEPDAIPPTAGWNKNCPLHGVKEFPNE